MKETHEQGPAQPDSKRIHGLDALRGVLMMLGIFLHSALAYMPGSDWPFVDWTATSRDLNLVTDGVHIFRMPAFFLLSGFFGALLWQRRGPRAMLKNRVARIVLPFAAFVMLLWPIIVFCFSFGGEVKEQQAEPLAGALNALGESGFLPEGTMHLWFLYDLIFVTAITVAIVALMGRFGLSWPRFLAATRRVIECPWRFLLVLGGLNFIWCAAFEWDGIPTEGAWIPSQYNIIAYYLLWYALGWMVFASDAVLAKCKERAWTLVSIGVLCVGIRHMARGHLDGPAAPSDGSTAQADPGLLEALGGLMGGLPPADSGFWELGGAFWTSLGLVAFTRGLMGLFLRYAGSGTPIWRYVSDSSYWVYLLHLPLTVVVPSALLGWQVPLFIKYPVCVALVLSMCWLSYDCLVRPSFVGRFLNGRRYPARHWRISAIGTVLGFGWLGGTLAFYPPHSQWPPPWRHGSTPPELLSDETVIYPVTPKTLDLETTLKQCVGVDRYILCPDRMMPKVAGTFCEAFGAELAIYESEAENSRVSRLASRLTQFPLWVGVTDAEVEGEWRWPDGTLLSYDPWHEGEPNNWGNEEHCATMNWGGAVKWNDIGCEERFGFVCERAGAAGAGE